MFNCIQYSPAGAAVVFLNLELMKSWMSMNRLRFRMDRIGVRMVKGSVDVETCFGEGCIPFEGSNLQLHPTLILGN